MHPVTSTNVPMAFGVTSDPQKASFELDQKTLSMMRSCLPNELYYVYRAQTTTKALWDVIKKSVDGNPRILEQRKEMVKRQFVVFRSMNGEKIEELIPR